MSSRRKLTIILVAVSMVYGLPAWIWLFFHDWKIALAIFCIMFSENISNRLTK